LRWAFLSFSQVNEPEWLVMSKKFVKEELPREPPARSSQQTDFGVHPTNDAPQARAYMYKSGMASTTNADLAEGTSKTSFHPPGYGGTIPTELGARNPVAGQQALAVDPRTKPGTLRMYYRHNMPGYQGWGERPALNVNNVPGEMTCGANPATTSGAAALNLML